MDWWQILLIILISIVIGLLVGGLLSYLILRLQKKPFSKKRETTTLVEEQLESTAPDLFAEVENNRRIATEPWTDKLLPFQTHVWDTNQDEVHRLTANLREDLTQAYLDMRQANDIVCLSTELGHRSHTLDEHYMKVCTRIAASLERIMPLLKGSGN